MRKNVFICFFILSFAKIHAQNTWSSIADFGGGQRERMVAFSIGSKGYVGTGQDTANNVKKDFWEYDPGTNSWTQKANLPGSARRDAIAFSIGSRGYIGTGINTAVSYFGTKQKDFYEYNPITNIWTAKANYPGNSNQGIYYATAFATDEKGYVCCGKKGPSSYSDQVYEYNPTTNSWTAKEDFPGGERYGISSFSIDGKGYVGLGVNENYYCNDMYCFDPVTNDWQPIADFIGSNRFNAVGFNIGERGFIAFGSDGGYKKDMYEYNPATDEWMQKANLSGSERRSCVAFVIDGYAYAGSGKGVNGLKRTFYKYKPYFFEPLHKGIDNFIHISSTVLPNPIKENGKIVIENSSDIASATLFVFDKTGNLKYQSSEINNSSFQIKQNEFLQGIYFYEIHILKNTNEQEISSGKIIIL